MKTSIFVLTPVKAFGELIRQSLEEAGPYRVTLGFEAQALTEALRTHPPQILLLDGDTPGVDLAALVSTVRRRAPRTSILVMPPEDWPPERVDALGADALVDKPFYLPTLLDLVAAFARERGEEEEEPSGAEEDASTLQVDVEQAAQYLARLTLASEAMAAALIRRDGRLLAYAGQLPRLAAEELAQTVAYYWEAGGHAEFARYLTLEAVRGDFMVYVTPLPSPHLALALLFEASTPFTRVREEATRLAQHLAQMAAEGPPSAEEAAPQPAPPAQEEAAPLEEDEEPWEEGLPEEARLPLFDDVPPPSPEDWAPEEPSTLSPQQAQEILEALHTAEAADTADANAADTVAARESPDASEASDAALAEAPTLAVPRPTSEAAPQAQAATPQQPSPPTERAPEAAHAEAEAPPATGPAAERPPSSAPSSPPWSEAETLPVSLEPSGGQATGQRAAPQGAAVGLEEAPTLVVRVTDARQSRPAEALPPPATLSRADLYYACVLVPRMPHHHLTGDLARSLSHWARRICTAFGWRLVHLAVRPTYLHWVVQVLPHTSPAYAVRVMREHTSARIFAQFPHLAHDNPSGDFWAPGYLVVGQAHPLSQKTILEFLWEVRHRQGVEE